MICVVHNVCNKKTTQQTCEFVPNQPDTAISVGVVVACRTQQKHGPFAVALVIKIGIQSARRKKGSTERSKIIPTARSDVREKGGGSCNMLPPGSGAEVHGTVE